MRDDDSSKAEHAKSGQWDEGDQDEGGQGQVLSHDPSGSLSVVERVGDVPELLVLLSDHQPQRRRRPELRRPRRQVERPRVVARLARRLGLRDEVTAQRLVGGLGGSDRARRGHGERSRERQ